MCIRDRIEDPVTEKSKTSIEAARKAYDALTKDQKNLVTNVKKLTDAETAYAKMCIRDRLYLV